MGVVAGLKANRPAKETFCTMESHDLEARLYPVTGPVFAGLCRYRTGTAQKVAQLCGEGLSFSCRQRVGSVMKLLFVEEADSCGCIIRPPA